MAFNAGTLGRALWPELGGVGVLILAHITARAVDGALAWDKPFRRVSDYVHVAALGGAGYMIGANRGGETAKAIFYADSGLVGTSLGDLLYDAIMGPAVARSRGRRTAEGIVGNQKVLATRRAAVARTSKYAATEYIGPGPVPGKEILA